MHEKYHQKKSVGPSCLGREPPFEKFWPSLPFCLNVGAVRLSGDIFYSDFLGFLENLKSCYKLKEFVFCLLFWLFSVTLKNISPLLCVQEEQYKLKEFVFCFLFWLFSVTLKKHFPLLCGRNKCGLLCSRGASREQEKIRIRI